MTQNPYRQQDITNFDKLHINEGMILENNVDLKLVECRVINGRKINVKAIMDIDLKIISNEDLEFVKSIILKIDKYNFKNIHFSPANETTKRKSIIILDLFNYISIISITLLIIFNSLYFLYIVLTV